MERIQTNLFIGGPLDGSQKILPPGPEYNDRIRFPIHSLPQRADGYMEEIPKVAYVEYRRETIAALDIAWDVWVLNGMTIQEAMAKLLADYRPEVTP